MKTLKSEPVFELFKKEIKSPSVETLQLLSFLETRIQKGIQTYGEELHTFNGRDALADAAEELGDALLYLLQYARECEFYNKESRFVFPSLMALTAILSLIFEEMEKSREKA